MGGTGEVAPKRIVVIGAGMVGIASAFYLRRDGHAVTVIDPREPGMGASFGNAGVISIASCVPIATPGLLRRIPAMLMDRTGPLSIRWRYVPQALPWLLRVLASSRPARAEAISKAIVALTSRADAAYDTLIQACGGAELVDRVGWLKVARTDPGDAAIDAEIGWLERRGLSYELLDSDDVHDLEPALAPGFRRGLLLPHNRFVRNPGRLVGTFARAFVDAGGRIEPSEVTGFELGEAGPVAVRTGDGAHACDIVVLAAGAWSRTLAHRLGCRVSLDTERGYHLMLPHPEPTLRRPVLSEDHQFLICPMQEGLRMTAFAEIAGLAAPPDYRRIRSLLPLARAMVPGLDPSPTSEWLGFRPSTPDTIPAIGPSPACPNAIMAFGHGHLGLTLGPVTGRIVADLVAGRDPGLDLTPYAPDRWQ